MDRVAKEAPDTLLLAEAFWMMEGFFVRSLGMHRVYNSAFMNMLRNEDNGNYRQLIKNTLEFDPEILKRYVNFMNNPDERTAVDQFGKGDKYFGVAVLMATMPGLPMFGHGQIEGYTEKYGMEFKRAYRDESPDQALVERHQKEIFPLLHRRSLFSGVQDFLLYDFFGGNGQVNEDVFAYSNASGGEYSLVVYNNRFSNASGWIRMSAGYIVKGPGDDKHIQQRTLSQGLGLHPAPDHYVVFRDLTANLEFVRSTLEIAEKGMFFDLGAYKYHVFADFREVQDDNYHSYAQLVEYLQGRGVPNVEQAMKELLLTPVLGPFKQIANAGYFRYLMANRRHTAEGQIPPELLDEAEQKIRRLVEGIGWLSGYNRNPNQVISEVRQKLEIVLSLHALEHYRPVPGGQKYQAALDYVRNFIGDDEQHWLTLLAWVFVHNLGKLASSDGFENQTQSWVEEWQFGRQLAQMGMETGMPQEKAWLLVNNLQLLVGQQNWYQDNLDETAETIVRQWLSIEEIQRFVGINRYKDVLWFNKELFEEFVWWMMIMAMLQSGSEGSLTASQFTEQVLGAYEMVKTILEAAEQSNYQVSKLLAGLKE